MTAPPPSAECRLTIAIPARNEEREIVATLEALIDQRSLAGEILDPRSYEILVLCNGCDDGTADAVRRTATRHPKHAVIALEADADEAPHVGAARAALFEIASKRAPSIASMDADTLAAPDWVAATLDALRDADAVGGFVRLSDAERDRLIAPARLLYDRELTYRRLLGSIEDRFDPRPFDPEPRHDALVGASFAVRTAAYRKSGGIPAVADHEDVAFARALQACDARVRHSYRVRATTSARSCARVDDGFGAFLRDLSERAGEHRSFDVRAANATIEWARARRLLRTLYTDGVAAATLEELGALTGLAEAHVVRERATAPNAGALALALESQARQTRYSREPVEDVIGTFRRVLSTDAGAAFLEDAEIS